MRNYCWYSIFFFTMLQVAVLKTKIKCMIFYKNNNFFIHALFLIVQSVLCIPLYTIKIFETGFASSLTNYYYYYYYYCCYIKALISIVAAVLILCWWIVLRLPFTLLRAANAVWDQYIQGSQIEKFSFIFEKWIFGT